MECFDIKEKLEDIVDGVSRAHEEAMSRLMKEGKHIALERAFRKKVKEHFNVQMFAFTDRERGNLSLLIRDLGEETAPFLLDAIVSWKDLRSQEYLSHLPPTPVFQDLFNNRQRIQSCIAEIKTKEERAMQAVKKAVAIEEKLQKNNAPSGISLVEMFKRSREQIRREKEAAQQSGGQVNG